MCVADPLCSLAMPAYGRKRSRTYSMLRSTAAVGCLVVSTVWRQANAFTKVSDVIVSRAVQPPFLASSLPLFATRTQTLDSVSRVQVDEGKLAGYYPSRTSVYDEYDLHFDDLDDDEDEDVFVEASVPGFKELQRSLGSEILPSDLQRQIDRGANSFLEHHVQDASMIEKVAMRSITEQLPQKAVQALLNRATTVKNDNSKDKPKRNNLLFAKDKRVTPEQEIELARIIRQGTALTKIRIDELRRGNDLTRQEWALLAGITPKELRRRISDYRKAKHCLVTANIGLVHAVVKQLWPYYSKTGVSKEELVQEGSLGLLRAAELFDPEKGLRFSTYAVVWIKGVLSNSHVPELVRLPAREKTKWNKILQTQRTILALSGNAAADRPGASISELCVPLEELSAASGISVAEILATQQRMSRAKKVLSLDYEYKTQSRSGADKNAVASVESRLHESDPLDADLAERTQLHADILAAMARNLDAREARLMRLRYGLSDGRARTLHECAESMGLSYTRVHQLAERCLKKLREAAEAESLEEYLLTIA